MKLTKRKRPPDNDFDYYDDSDFEDNELPIASLRLRSQKQPIVVLADEIVPAIDSELEREDLRAVVSDFPPWWEDSISARARDIWLPPDQDMSFPANSTQLEGKSSFTLNNIIELQATNNANQPPRPISASSEPTDEKKTVNSILKVRLYPTKPQVRLLNKMFGTHRAIYNKLVEEVPEGVMDSTYGDYEKALKSSMALFKELRKKDKKTSFPELKFKSKKHNSSSIELRARDIKSGFGYVRFVPKYFGFSEDEGMKIMHELPEFDREFEQATSTRACAIDLGVQNFITMYDPEGVTLGVDDASDEIFRRCLIIDRAISRKTKKTKKRKRYRQHKRVYHMFRRVKSMIADMHHKVSSWLSRNYCEVLLPSFQTSEMSSKQKQISSKCSRAMLTWSHYKFKMMLEHKMERSGGKMIECEEHYTTKTCSRCWRINRKITHEKVFQCLKCELRMDRDVNAARNIFLKNELKLTRAPRASVSGMPTPRLSAWQSSEAITREKMHLIDSKLELTLPSG